MTIRSDHSLSTPKSLFGYLGELLRGRENFGLPLQLVDVKSGCGARIRMAVHSAFSTA